MKKVNKHRLAFLGVVVGLITLMVTCQYYVMNPGRFFDSFYDTFRGTSLPVNQDWEVIYFNLDTPSLMIGVLPSEVDFDFAVEEMKKIASEHAVEESRARFFVPNKHGGESVYLARFDGKVIIAVHFGTQTYYSDERRLRRYGFIE